MIVSFYDTIIVGMAPKQVVASVTLFCCIDSLLKEKAPKKPTNNKISSLIKNNRWPIISLKIQLKSCFRQFTFHVPFKNEDRVNIISFYKKVVGTTCFWHMLTPEDILRYHYRFWKLQGIRFMFVKGESW